MKRAAELHGLSHDHHQALHWALQLKRSESADEPAQPFLDFWHGHAASTSESRRRCCCPAGRSSRTPSTSRWPPGCWASTWRCGPRCCGSRAGELGLDARRALGVALERHVRFEERELFPAIEAGLDEAALAELGARLAQAEGELGQPTG